MYGEGEGQEGTGSVLEELYTYKGLSLDDHPALTRLQNEQNTRLENMEHRMNRIRTNAQKAYDRKKFAHIFRARDSDAHTDRLLQEANAILQHTDSVNCDSPQSGAGNPDYKGEIIPVRFVDDPKPEPPSDNDGYLPFAAFGSIRFSKCLFCLLPVFKKSHLNHIYLHV